MFELSIEAGTLPGVTAALARLNRAVSDAERIDQLRALEDLKAAAAAAQAQVAADLDSSQRAAQAAAGVPARDLGSGVAAQVALARRESPHRGGRLLGLAKALVSEMPHTFDALRTGHLSEWRATLLVRETACLTREDRSIVDERLGADVERLASFGDARLVAEARRLAYLLDPHAVVDRAARAHADRTVTLRPAPDTMSYLTALLPVAQGVAAYAALGRHADARRAGGDARSRSQIMADILVERLTGRTTATGVPVSVNLVMGAGALLDPEHPERDVAAHVDGYGTIPAGVARRLVSEAERAWVRRLYADPVTGTLTALESRARLFPAGLRRLIVVRDQTCRTPWCDAPIRHHDHVVDHAAGGSTSAANGQGLCERCNHVKQTHGWRARPRPGPRPTVETTTPTGHLYSSSPPSLPGDTRAGWFRAAPGLWHRTAA